LLRVLRFVKAALFFKQWTISYIIDTAGLGNTTIVKAAIDTPDAFRVRRI